MKLWLGLAARSLRNRLFTTFLTVFSIACSVALLIGVDRVRLGARESFNNTISQTDLVVGARTSPLQLLLYSVFHIGEATQNLSFKTFERFRDHPAVEWVIPLSLGDSHEGYRVVATNESFYENYRFRVDQALSLRAGNIAKDIFDVVLGSEVAEKLGYRIGDPLVLSHGVADGFLKHEDKPFRVVGILAATVTPIDRSLYITLEGMEAIHMDWKNGAPPEPGQGVPASQIQKGQIRVAEITAFLLRSKSRIGTLRLQREINDFEDEALVAVIPGVGMAKLWEMLSYGEDALRLVSVFVIIVGFIGMLIAIYTSLHERRREMSILRALGAGPRQVIFLLVVESGLLTLLGILGGLALVYSLLWAASPYLVQSFGLYIPITALGIDECYVLFGILLGGILIGLIPAYRAYRNVVSDGLSLKV